MSEKYKHKVPGEYLFERMLLCDIFPKKNVLRAQAMELEPSDVVVASYPKTGTTVLQEIVWLIRNNGDTEKANEKVNVERVPFIELNDQDYFEVLANLPHPRHMKTHLPYKFLPKTAREGKTKVVCVLRNPKDCLVSYYHFHRMCEPLGKFKGTWNDFFDYFMERDGILLFGNVLEHYLGYWEHKDDANLHIVFYEDIVLEPKESVVKIAEFLECQLSEKVLDKIVAATSFDTMKVNPMTNMMTSATSFFDHSISPFMRKGKVGDWKNYFNEEQNKIMDELIKDKFQGTELHFIYE